MLIVTGLLTLLAIAHVRGDPIKGGFHAKGGSIAQEKVTQEEVIPSPFSTKTAAAYGTKVISQKTAEAVSKTAPEPRLHHAAKIYGKAQPSSGVHHAATSPVVQDQVIIDPTLDSSRGIKTVKTITNVRDPIARPVQSLKTVGTKEIFSSDDTQVRDPIALPVVQPVTRIIQEEVKMRDPIARPVIQTTKTSEDPLTGTKTVKTAIKTNEASKLRSTKTSKISQGAVQYGIPESIVAASRSNSLLTSSVDTPAALLSRQSMQVNNAVGLSTINTGMGVMNEFGEVILDEETLQTLRNAGGLLDDNGQIALNDVGLKLLQSVRGENILQNLPGSPNIAVSNQMGGPSATLNTRTEILRKPESTASRSYLRTNEQIQRVGSQSRRRPSEVTLTPVYTSPARTAAGTISGISSPGSTLIATNEELLNPVPYTGRIEMNRIVTGSRVSTESARRGSIGTSTLGVRPDLKAENPETVLFNGKEIRISGIQAGQLFDENLNPITSENTQADILKSSILPQVEKPIITPVLTPTRNSGLTGMARIRETENRRRGSAQTVRRIQNVERVTSNVNLNNQGISRAGSIRPVQNAGTVLFNGKEIQIDGLREGQLFDENLQPLYPVNPSIERAVVPNIAEIKPVTNFGIRTGSTVSSSSGIAGSLNSGSFGVREGAQRVPSTGLRARQRKPVPNIFQTSGQGQLRTKPLDISPGVVTTTSGERFFQRIPNTNTGPNIQSSQPTSFLSSKPQVTSGEAVNQIVPGSNDIESIDTNMLNLGGITSSGDSVLTGTVLFDGKEISIDGVKPGQLFDENLSPIAMQNSGAIDEKITIIQNESPRARVPSRNTLRTAGVVSSQNIQTAGLRSSNVATSDRVTSEALRLSGMRSSVRTGVPSSQAIGGIRPSSNALTSGSVLFNGKEISVDGLRAGQLFDENLQPILTGSSGSLTEKSAILTGVSGVTGSQSSGIAGTTAVRSAQRTQTSNLRIPTQTTSARGVSRTSGTRLSQLTPSQRLRSPVSGISSTQRTSQGITTIRSPGDFIASRAGIRSSSNSLTSGSVLFNGKEISIDGLKAGQLFDENLRPILSGAPGSIAEKSATLGGISGVSGIQSSGVARTSGVTSTLRTQTSSLRTPSQTSSARGISSTSRTSQLRTGQRLRSSVPGAISIERGAQGTTAIRPSGGSVTSGIGSSSGALTSGSVLFNGKEISIDGLKAGQLFDENLRPILSGAPGSIAEKSATLGGVSRVSGIQSSGVARTSGVTSTLRTQTSSLGTPSQTSSARGISSTSRTSQLRTGQRLRSSVPGAVSIQRGVQGTTAIRPSGGSVTSGIGSSSGALTSGSVLFNGKEISIDGLKAGQLFDENLQPINTGISGAVAEKSATLPGVSRVSGTRTNTAARVTGSSQAQRGQTNRLRSSSMANSARVVTGTSGISGTRLTQSAPNLGVQPFTNTISSERQVFQLGTGTGSLDSSLPSGSVLFNGNEISIDGLKAGQIFDENLRPVQTGTLREVIEKSPMLPGVSQIGGVPYNTAAITSNVASTVRSRTDSLRIPSQVTSARGISRTSQSRPSQILRSTAAGALPIQRTSQGMSAVRSSGGSVTSSAGIGSSSGALTTGSVLFNGKEISIDGLKAGQLFDENLQPINTGISGAIAEKSATLSGVSRVSGTRTNTAARVTGSSQAQRGQTNRLRSSLLTNSARVVAGTSSTSGTRLTQSVPSVGFGSSSGAITTGSVLFNGKEISIDGLKAGQLFDENLQPINTGISGAIAEKSATLSGVSRISGVRSATATRVTGSTTAQRTQGNRLRSSPLTNSARVVAGTSSTSGTRLTQSVPSVGFGSSSGAITTGSVLFNGKEISIDGLKAGQLFDENLQPINTGILGAIAEKSATLSGVSRISGVRSATATRVTGSTTAQRTQGSRLRSSPLTNSARVVAGTSSTSGTRLTQSVPSVGFGSLSNSVSSISPNSQGVIPGSAPLDGSLTSGTVLFDGKEVSIDGLKAGQFFDANLNPIPYGTSGSNLEKLPAVSGVPQLSGIQSVSTGGTSTLRAQTSSLRSPAESPSSRGIIGTSRLSQPIPNLRAGSLNSRTSSTRTQTNIGIPSGGSLTSGSVLFNGQEISVDGLKAGQLFDENLRPILTETSAARMGSIARTSGEISSQRTQIGGLRSSEPTLTRSMSGTSGLSGVRRSQSTSSLRSGISSNSVSSAGRVSAIGVGMRSSTSPNTSSRSSQSIQNLRAGSALRNIPSIQTTSQTAGGTRLTGTTNSAGSISLQNPSIQANPQIIPTSNSLSSGTVLFNGKEIYMDGLKDGMIFDENLRPIVSGTAVLSTSSDINYGSNSVGSIASATNLRSGATASNVLPVRSAGITAISSGASTRGGIVPGLRSQTVSSQSPSASRNNLDVIDVTRTDAASIPTGILAADSSIGNTGPISSQDGLASVLSGGTVPFYASGYGSRGAIPSSRLNQKRINEDISGKPLVQEQALFAIQEPAAEQSVITKPEALKSVQVQEPISFTVSNTPKTFATKISQLSQRDIDTPSVQQKLMSEEFSGYLPKTSFLPPFNYAVPQHAISGYNVKSPVIHQQQKIEQVFV